MKKRVLAICIHNSARSQMTEELLRLYGNGKVDVLSAGIEPGKVNPLVAQVLQEDHGIDISSKQTRSVADLHTAGESFDTVIAVCDPEASERCPIFPAEEMRLHWPFPDPSALTGSDDEKMIGIRKIKEMIEKNVREYLATL